MWKRSMNELSHISTALAQVWFRRPFLGDTVSQHTSGALLLTKLLLPLRLS